MSTSKIDSSRQECLLHLCRGVIASCNFVRRTPHPASAAALVDPLPLNSGGEGNGDAGMDLFAELFMVKKEFGLESD